MNIIIEGMDRTGKDTQIDLLISKFSDKIFHKLHYTKLPFKDKEHQIKYSKLLYEEMFNLMDKCNYSNMNLIFNRAHLGEFVYSPKYREYSGDYVFSLERDWFYKLDSINRFNTFLIVLVNDDYNSLLNREDGDSLSSKKEDLEYEFNAFSKAVQYTLIYNTLLINCKDLSIEDVHNLIYEFITKKLHGF